MSWNVADKRGLLNLYYYANISASIFNSPIVRTVEINIKNPYPKYMYYADL